MGPEELCGITDPSEIEIKVTYKDGYVFVEGDVKTLEFVGNLFIAQAKYREDCGFELAYNGPGQAFFDKSSNAGLYIHRIPCLHQKEEKGSTAG